MGNHGLIHGFVNPQFIYYLLTYITRQNSGILGFVEREAEGRLAPNSAVAVKQYGPDLLRDQKRPIRLQGAF